MLIFFGLSRNLITTALRDFFAFIDSIAFTVFGWILQVIFDIANADIVQDSVFDSLQNRIYIFLGIFMLFKVTVSLLSYLVNPDKIADKEKGMGKMVTRTVVVLIMLIGFPAVFNLMQSVQNDLLEALPRIIIGRNTSTESTGEEMDGISDSVSWSIFQLSLGEGDADLMCPDPSDSSTCINTVSGAVNVISDPADGNKSEFKYQYKFLIGTIIAILMTILLVGIAIDVAIRAFKLLILRMIAPIPIISYIDPKSSKDGAFASWTKLLISTWLDLFIKLGVLYLVLYLLDIIIIQGGLSIGATLPFFRRLVLIVFLIIGLFFFAKQAPKFISDALGIKSKESGSLFGGLAKVATAGAIGVGTVGSALAAGRASYMADEANGKEHNFLNRAKNVGAALFGGVTGAATGAGAALNAKDHASRAAMDAMNKTNSAKLAAGAQGSTGFGRAFANMQRLATGQDTAGRLSREVESYDKLAEEASNRSKAQQELYDYMVDRGVKKFNNTAMKVPGSGRNAMTYSDFSAAWELAKANGAQKFSVNGETFDTFSNATAAFDGDFKEAIGTAWAYNNANDSTLVDYQNAAGYSGVQRASDVKSDYKSAAVDASRYKGESRKIKESQQYKVSKANSNSLNTTKK